MGGVRWDAASLQCHCSSGDVVAEHFRVVVAYAYVLRMHMCVRACVFVLRMRMCSFCLGGIHEMCATLGRAGIPPPCYIVMT